jgi:hypothetical protein
VVRRHRPPRFAEKGAVAGILRPRVTDDWHVEDNLGFMQRAGLLAK